MSDEGEWRAMYRRFGDWEVKWSDELGWHVVDHKTSNVFLKDSRGDAVDMAKRCHANEELAGLRDDVAGRVLGRD